MAKQILARLVRGQVYFLGNKEFRNGVAVEVTKAERNHLEEHAVDLVTVTQGDEAEPEERPKFDFEEVDITPEAADEVDGDAGATGDGKDEEGADVGQGNARGGSRRR